MNGDARHFRFPVAPQLFDARVVFAAIDRTNAIRVLSGADIRSQLGELALHLATREEVLRLF